MAQKGGKPSDLLARMGRSVAVTSPITTDHLAEAAAHDGDPAEEARLSGLPLVEALPEQPAPEPAPTVTAPAIVSKPTDDIVGEAPPLQEPVPPVAEVTLAPAIETPPFHEPVPPTHLNVPAAVPAAEATPADVPAAEPKKRKPARRGDKLPRRLPGPKDSVRFSLDLERTRHKEFKTFSLLEAEIDAAVVGRVLVEMMLEDPALKARVLARVAQLKSDYLARGDTETS